MTFRITRIDDQRQTTLKVDGRLQADGLAEFERACGDPSARLTLDLRGLRQADEASLAMLRRLRAAGVTFEGLSSYLTLRLGPVSPEDKPRR
jgi:hypothetical protein